MLCSLTTEKSLRSSEHRLVAVPRSGLILKVSILLLLEPLSKKHIETNAIYFGLPYS